MHLVGVTHFYGLYVLSIRDVSVVKITRFSDADAYANIRALRSTEADAHANIKGWRSADANADANIRARRSADANVDANIWNIINTKSY